MGIWIPHGVGVFQETVVLSGSLADFAAPTTDPGSKFTEPRPGFGLPETGRVASQGRFHRDH
jgi:hypothetical protein